MTGIAASAGGHGYWLLDAAGRVYAYGNARLYGHPSARPQSRSWT